MKSRWLLATHYSPLTTQDSPLAFPQKHSYLCASCPSGQAIFLSFIGDDGFRPAATQPKQTGDADRPHTATVGRSVGAMNG
jgi:hypothetical protein